VYLLDTCAVSDLRRATSDPTFANLATWAAGVPAARQYLSCITVMEIDKGVRRVEAKARRSERAAAAAASHRATVKATQQAATDQGKAAALRSWFEKVMSTFDGRIWPIDVAVARAAAAMHVEEDRPFADSLVAATGQVHGLTIITRNEADFALFGVDFHNPW
jgi:toxin FitB